MNIVATGLQEPDRLAPSTHEAIRLAQEEAVRMQAQAVYPEHLLLGVIAQGENKAAKMMCRCGMDMPAIRVRATEVFGSQYMGTANTNLPLSKESLGCIEWAISVVTRRVHPALVLPEHLVLGVLRHPRMKQFLAPFSSSVELMQGYLTREMWTDLIQNSEDLLSTPTEIREQEGAAEDFMLRREIQKEPNAAISHIKIERPAADQVIVTIYTAKPGIMIGKRGEKVHKLQSWLEAITRKHIRLNIVEIRQREVATPFASPGKRCPACKKETLPGWKHCAYCGASLARTCPNCGAAQPEVEEAQYCFECGTPLENEMQPDIKVVEELNAPERGVRFSKGQQVYIVDGPFTEYIGTVVDVDAERNKVTVLISFFGRETPVVLDFLQVKKI